MFDQIKGSDFNRSERGSVLNLKMLSSDWIWLINTVWYLIESPMSSYICYKYVFMSAQSTVQRYTQVIESEVKPKAVHKYASRIYEYSLLNH